MGGGQWDRVEVGAGVCLLYSPSSFVWACAVAGHLALQRQGVVVRETVVGILKELERMPRFLKDLRPVAQRPGVSWLRRPQRSAVGAQVPTPSMAAHRT